MDKEDIKYKIDKINKEDNLNLKETVEKYTAKWYWFVLSLVICFAGAHLYLRYTPISYEVTGTLFLLNENSGKTGELAAFYDLGVLPQYVDNVDNEIQVLRSRQLMNKVVSKLNLNVRYYDLGKYRKYLKLNERDLYGVAPIKMDFYKSSSHKPRNILNLYVSILSDDKLDLHYTPDTKGQQISMGDKVSLAIGDVIFTPGSSFSKYIGKEIKIVVLPVNLASKIILSKLNINKVGSNTSVLRLSMVAPVQEEAIDVLTNLMNIYNEEGINSQSQIAANTLEFINDRLELISKDLNSVEVQAEHFKRANQVTDIAEDAGLFREWVGETRKKLNNISTQLSLVEYLADYLSSSVDISKLIPSNIGIDYPRINNLTDNYNKLVLERDRLLKSSSPSSPVIINIEEQLKKLKANLIESLDGIKSSLQIQLNGITQQEKELKGKISAIPTQERKYRAIIRKQSINENLYVYLLKKREEAAISKAVTVAKAKIIDLPSTKGPVHPQPSRIYLIAFFVGLILPVGGIYISDLLDTKVHSTKDLEYLNIPIIGELPKSKDKKKYLPDLSGNQPTAEALRLIRTNLLFLLKGQINSGGQVIFVSSGMKGEGKTFIAINLAKSLAAISKKVLLLGTDMRAPKLLKYLELERKKGLSDFLSNEDMSINDVIFQHERFSDLYILASGTIPPNPSELLIRPRMGELFEVVKQHFDYIIVDTAPIAMVTDTLLISEYADLLIFVIRADLVDKRQLKLIEILKAEGRIHNVGLLLNEVGQSSRYGYGYGYGYGHNTTKKWWKFW